MNDIEADLLIANAKIKQLEEQLADAQRRGRANYCPNCGARMDGEE